MKHPVASLFVLFAAAAGCAGSSSELPAGDDVTWFTHIEPMVQTYCVRCHQDGGSGIGDFTDPEIFTALSEVALSRIDAGEMPPPVADPACRDYEGSEQMWFPEEQRDLLASWIEDGKPLGKEKDRVEVEVIEPQLEDPDLEIRIPVAYAPTYTDEQNPGNEYRCFYLEHGQEEDFFITAMHPIIDQPSILHHAVLGRADKSEVPENYDPAVGFDCIRRPQVAVNEDMLGAWAPGAVPIEFKNGEGLRISKDEVFVLQLHYFQSGPDAVGLADQSGYTFKTAASVARSILMLPLGAYSFEIPAGDSSYTHTDQLSLNYGLDVEVYGGAPHMHVLGTELRAWITNPDGTESCVFDGGFDFNNQLMYMFKEPLRIENGSTMHISCTWDNSESNPNQHSDPPQTTYYGERTDEEMCFSFTYVGLAN